MMIILLTICILICSKKFFCVYFNHIMCWDLMSLVELFQMSLAYGISLFISIKNFLLRFFGPFHTVYFLQDGKRKNITIQYLMGFIKDDGIYCIHTKYEGGETAIVISGDINYVDDYIDKFTMPIIDRKSVV